MRLVVVVLVLLVSSVSFADEFGGWRFKAPPGTREVEGDHVSFTKITGKSFCKYGLFTARAPTGDGDAADEWKNIVESTFTTTNVGKPVAGKTKNLEYVAMSSSMTSGGSAFEGTLYILATGNAIASLLVLSSTRATLAKCPAKAMLDSIVLATAPAAAAPTATAGQPAATSASAAKPSVAIAGRWGTAASSYHNGFSLGYQARQYAFGTDGTYVFHFEAWGGHSRSGFYHLIHETGKYTLAGDQLTIVPSASTQTVIDEHKKTKQVSKGTTEKTTYAVQRHYMEGIQEWNLVMTTPKQTFRDGAFTNNSAFPSSYLLTLDRKTEWKYPF